MRLPDNAEKRLSASALTKPSALLALAALTVFAFLIARNYGTYATIMWDEWEYNRYARQLPLSAADVPYYLYFLTFGFTKSCGSGFLTCAQIANAFFFAASLPFLYLTCRRTAPQGLSLAVALASVLGGISVYATHFMPEPMYFFGFWLGAWGLLTFIDLHPSPAALGLSVGSAIAVLSLIKLHALFLLPGIILFFFVCHQTGLIAGKRRDLAITATLFLIAFFAVRLSLGYLIADNNGLSLTGATYGNQAQSTFTSSSLIDLARHALPFFAGHILALTALFGVPLLLMISLRDRKTLALQALTGCLLLPLLGVVALYTARVSLLDPEIEGANGLLRLHMRYYDFLFPLFVIFTAHVATAAPQPTTFTAKRAFAAALVSGMILHFVSTLSNYQLSVADAPELRGFATLRPVAYALAAIGIAAAIIWTRNPKLAARLYLFAFFPLLTLSGAGAAFMSAHKEKTPNAYHSAGLFAKDYLGNEISKLAVVGSDYAGVYHAMFYADNPDIAHYNKIPEHSCLDFQPSPNGKEWIFLVGDYTLNGQPDRKIERPGYSLVHTAPSTVHSADCHQTHEGQ